MTFDRISFMVVFLGVLALFLVFVISPFIQALYYGMTDWTGFSPNFNFVGFDNYVKLAQDDIFRKSVFNSVLLAVVVPFATIVLALLFASLVTVAGGASGGVRGLKGSSFYRIVSFFPYTVPPSSSASSGPRSTTRRRACSTGSSPRPASNSSSRSRGSARCSDGHAGVDVRHGVGPQVGFYTVLFVAAIKGVPAEIYEAARLDGAGRIRHHLVGHPPAHSR